MPTTARAMPILVWAPEGDELTQALGAIQVSKGHKMNRSTYLALLSNRLNRLIRDEAEPVAALARAVARLDEADLLNQTPTRVEQAGSMLIFDNLKVREILNDKGIPGQLPKQIQRDNPKARRLAERTSLDSWLTMLLDRPSDSQ